MSMRGPNVSAGITRRADTNSSRKNSPQKNLSERGRHQAGVSPGYIGRDIPCGIGGTYPRYRRGILGYTPTQACTVSAARPRRPGGKLAAYTTSRPGQETSPAFFVHVRHGAY